MMFDTGRTHSIVFQCDPDATGESILAGGGETTGCGYPGVARFYYIVF